MSSQKSNALKSKFLASLSDEDRAHVFSLTEQLARPVGAWMARYSTLMRPVRLPQGCLTLAATAPFLDAAALQPTAQLIFWIFAVDDIVDEGLQPIAEVWPRLERALSLLERPESTDTGGDPLLEALRDIRDGLARSPFFATSRPLLARALRDFVSCMQREYDWSAAFRNSPERPSPSFDEYLDSERRTTGSLPILLCMLTMLGDDSVAEHLPRLLDMEREIAVSIRLANDLRGYERETGEGKLNALGILQREVRQREPGLDDAAALERARTALKERMPQGLERSLQLAKAASTRTGRAESFLTNLVSFTCDFYAHHDYHHVLVKTHG